MLWLLSPLIAMMHTNCCLAIAVASLVSCALSLLLLPTSPQCYISTASWLLPLYLPQLPVLLTHKLGQPSRLIVALLNYLTLLCHCAALTCISSHCRHYCATIDIRLLLPMLPIVFLPESPFHCCCCLSAQQQLFPMPPPFDSNWQPLDCC